MKFGVDILNKERIESQYLRHGQYLLEMVLTTDEQTIAKQQSEPSLWVAQVLSLKEAAVKALGTGFSSGVSWKQVEIIRLVSGIADIIFHGRAHEIYQGYQVKCCQAHVSIAGNLILANVSFICEGEQNHA